MRIFKDDRGRSYNDVFGTALGDVNISVLYPDAIKAWHMHEHQTDHWFCVSGHLKVGIQVPGNPVYYVYLSEGDSVVIPPKTWHGVHNISGGESILLYYISPKYDEKSPDEIRRPWNSEDQWERSRK